MAHKYGDNVLKLAVTLTALTFGLQSNAGLSFISRMIITPTTINWDFTASGVTLPPSLTLTRSSTATYLNGSGTIATAAANEARIDFQPAASGPYTQNGLLLEPAATNIALYSEQIDHSGPWFIRQVTVTANSAATTAPDGSNNAELVKEDSTNNYHALFQDSITHAANSLMTYSLFIKAAGVNRVQVQVQDATSYANGFMADFYFTNNQILNTGQWGNGSYSASSLTAYPNGWYRLVITGKASTTKANSEFQINFQQNSGTASFLGDGSSGVYLWGAQVEAGSYATSYIPTVAAAVTRAADQVAFNTMSWYNSTQGTLFAQFIDIGTYSAQTYRVFGLFNTNAAGTFMQNEVSLGNMGTTNKSAVTSANVAQFSPAGTLNAAGSVNKMAISYMANSFAFALNGAAPVTASSGSLPTAAGYAYIGSQPDGYIRPRWIQKIKYFSSKIANGELQTLTQ
jgi:hypothetical protein